MPEELVTDERLEVDARLGIPGDSWLRRQQRAAPMVDLHGEKGGKVIWFLSEEAEQVNLRTCTAPGQDEEKSDGLADANAP